MDIKPGVRGGGKDAATDDKPSNQVGGFAGHARGAVKISGWLGSRAWERSVVWVRTNREREREREINGEK